MKTTPTHDGKVDFDTVLELGALLPGVKASCSNLGVALKLKGQLVVCTAINPLRGAQLADGLPGLSRA